MRYLLGIIITLLCFQFSNAQYTELINSRRPGFSDSPYSVGTDVLQFENGLFYRNIKDNLYGNKVSSIGSDVMVRYGKFFEKLEINLNAKFQYDNINFSQEAIDFNNELKDVKGFTFSQLTLGGKYLVYSSKYQDKSQEIRSWKKRTAFDWKRLIPAVGVYAGVNFPVTKNYVGGFNSRYQKDGFSPKIALFTQNNFTDKFVFVSNFIMDRIGADEKENSYIFTGTYSVNQRWSIFAEHQGIFKGDSIPNDYQFGGGVAYLFSKNIQVDFSARAINDRDGSTVLINAGFAWRIDKHKDSFKVIGADGKAAEGDKKGGFFSRIFGKKNKQGKQRKVKKIKAKKRKIKKDKPRKKSKAQKRREKEADKKAKEERKKRKKEAKNYKKNYDPKKDKDNNDS